MRKFIARQMANLKEWFVASNRWVHLIIGWGIYIVMAFAIGLPQGMDVNAESLIVGSYLATLIAMVGVEVKDKMKGGAFDWKDINAGMFLGNCMLLAYIIVTIVRAC